ncbi:glycerol-3-phosphate dehydrogenase [Mycoplasma testudineum]|uniref:Glycerol-3-phosphate dehydrogenase n=1 Tax=Mycoplasma testudineum TaxID=244584 RepID=A0A4R6IBS9_9MOLU|nr:type 2 glycerol-3-phosphate oxidase [Mycoplasma testudineum]OYD26561.1 glycerol-3-phosphate dehydrogenase [Mycoplasma testudineum]TDO19392.1 glycerol-3-phosphate dehydrogenase [Mycoplasma testudineum]
MRKYDVLIIGGGIIGASIAYELAKYELTTLLVEKNPVFAKETSKGNSGAIHGGFDPEPGKLEAKLNVLGNEMWRNIVFKDLTFPRAQLDSLIIAFSDEEMKHVHMLYQRGLTNKVPAEFMKVLSKEEVLKKEPNLNPDLKGALLCTSSWAINTVKATEAFIGASKQNGTQTQLNSKVTAIKEVKDGFEVEINLNEKIFAKRIINAAGHYADIIAQMAGYPDFKLTTRRGEYRVLDSSQSGIVNSICFMVPTIHGKGVIVTPTLDGNILVGPTAEDGVAKEDTLLVTRKMYDYIGKIGKKIVPSLDLERTSMVFSGSRPIDIETNDFIIKAAKSNKNFINAAGMQSPAIASAPAIALEIVKLLQDSNLDLKKRSNFNAKFEVI